ncbi:hypothetical protein HK405_011264 [Cladochytrium tenue]|nr:hypothetical protein HK405_011264 [Cladochytrium tenue]
MAYNGNYGQNGYNNYNYGNDSYGQGQSQGNGGYYDYSNSSYDNNYQMQSYPNQNQGQAYEASYAAPTSPQRSATNSRFRDLNAPQSAKSPRYGDDNASVGRGRDDDERSTTTLMTSKQQNAGVFRSASKDQSSTEFESKMRKLSDDDMYEIEPRKRSFWGTLYAYLCCCIPKNPVNRAICFIVTGIVLAALIVVGYLYFPRFPTIQVLAIEMNHIQGGFVFAMDPNYPNNLNKMTISVNLAMNVSVMNPNLYDMNVELIDLSAYLMVNQSALSKAESVAALGLSSVVGPAPTGAPSDYTPSYTPKIGFSNASNLIFPSKQNVTFGMTFTLQYSPDPEVGLIKDPAFAEVMNVCGQTGTARPALIDYVATSTVKSLKSIGYTPSVSGSIKINCPVSSSQISAFEDAVKGGESVSDALSSAFGSS